MKLLVNALLNASFLLSVVVALNVPAKELQKIIHGSEAVQGQFPWMLSLESSSDGGKTFGHRCGAAILSERWALTAAHCVYDQTTSRRLRIAAGQLDRAQDSGKEQYVNVETTISHPDYQLILGSYSAMNDIALVKLSSNVKFNEYVATVALPKKQLKVDNEIGVLSGWGLTYNSAVHPARLHWTSANIHDRSFCESEWGTLLYRHETMLCWAGIETGSCNGDSGSPLVFRKADNSYVVVGVVSYGKNFCIDGANVFTRVSAFRDWIDTTMRDN